jgi:hypothetical protein
VPQRTGDPWLVIAGHFPPAPGVVRYGEHGSQATKRGAGWEEIKEQAKCSGSNST